jgi:hypothetical protein
MAFDVNNGVERVTDIGLHGTVGQLHTALENAAGEARQRLRCGARVNARYLGRRPGPTIASS